MPNQSDNRSANVYERIRELGIEFRKQLSRGKKTKIEDYLKRIPPEGRQDLFSQLLDIEVSYRQRQGEDPGIDEYIKRFPKYRRQIRRAFFEPTLDSVSSAASTDGEGQTATFGDSKKEFNDRTATFEIPDASRLGDYELIRELGRGGMGIVYEARHTKTGNRVALKTLPTGGDGKQVNADKLYRFRKEFRGLSEINHPNLVGMQSLEVDGDRWFFTMDLIDGEDFLSYVRPDDRLDESRLRSCLRQLAGGIMELHGRGIIHRDLKPSNVLVSKDGHVAILDFGLAAQLQQAGDVTMTRSGMFAGTPRYAAPEQMFGQRSEASDWYAFGTMLYEALTGESPYTGKNPIELLRHKQNNDARSLASSGKFNRDLSLLADGLLKRDPDSRLGISSVLESLALDVESEALGFTARSHGSTGSVNGSQPDPDAFDEEEVVLIGREEQLAQLEAIKSEFLENRRPKVVWISGKSGEGKSALVEKFSDQLHGEDNILILKGRCYDRETIPFKAIDCWTNSLVSHLRSKPAKELESQLPNDISLLAHLFPALKRIPSIAQRPTLQSLRIDEGQMRKRAFYAIQKLFCAISAERQIILIIEDLQWGDAESAEALFDLLRSPEMPGVLFVGSHRAEEEAQSEFLRRWEDCVQSTSFTLPTERVTVGSFTNEQCGELLSRRLGLDSAQYRSQIDELMTHTGGNPYLVEQLIEHFDLNSGQFEPLELKEIIDGRLSRLPEEARACLAVSAVAGRALTIGDLALFVGESQFDFGIVVRMRNERLLRFVGSAENLTIDTYHDRIRETVLSNMNRTKRVEWHRKIGVAIEELVGVDHDQLALMPPILPEEIANDSLFFQRVSSLAFHFHEAGDSKAFLYQFLAGERAAYAFAWEAAKEHLLIADELTPDGCSRATLYRLSENLGQVCLRLRDSDLARSSFDRCIKLASTPLEHARAYSGIGLMYLQQGALAEAMENYDLALRELGEPRPITKLGFYASCIGDTFRLLLLPDRWQRTSDTSRSEEAKLLFAIHSQVMGFIYDVEPVLSYIHNVLRSYQSALRTCDSNCLAGAYGYLATLFAATGIAKSLGRRFLWKSQQLQAKSTALELEGVMRHWNGVANLFLGEMKRARDELVQAIEESRKFGTDFNVSDALHSYRRMQNWLGSATDELEAARQELELAQISGNWRFRAWAMYGIAYANARLGCLAEACRFMQMSTKELEGRICPATRTVYGAICSFLLLQCSRYPIAAESSCEIWQMTRENRIEAVFNVPAYCFWIEGLAGPEWNCPARADVAKQLRKAVKQSLGLRIRFPVQRYRIHRALGRAFAAMGKLSRAQSEFETAVKLADRYEIGYEMPRALLDLAVVKEADRAENRADAISRLKNLESVIPRAESWLLGDQYDEEVVAPEFNLDAWEQEHGPIIPTSESPKR